MINQGTKRKAVATLLLVMLLLGAICCFVANHIPVDLFAPVVAIFCVLLFDRGVFLPVCPLRTQKSVADYQAASPDRAPPFSA